MRDAIVSSCTEQQRKRNLRHKRWNHARIFRQTEKILHARFNRACYLLTFQLATEWQMTCFIECHYGIHSTGIESTKRQCGSPVCSGRASRIRFALAVCGAQVIRSASWARAQNDPVPSPSLKAR